MANLFKRAFNFLTASKPNNADLAKCVNLYDGYKIIRAELDLVSSISLIQYTKLKKSNLIKRTPPFYVMSMEKFLLAAIISNHPLGQKDELLASLKLFEIANGLMELISAEAQLPTSLDYSVLEDEIKKRRNAS